MQYFSKITVRPVLEHIDLFFFFLKRALTLKNLRHFTGKAEQLKEKHAQTANFCFKI